MGKARNTSVRIIVTCINVAGGGGLVSRTYSEGLGEGVEGTSLSHRQPLGAGTRGRRQCFRKREQAAGEVRPWGMDGVAGRDPGRSTLLPRALQAASLVSTSLQDAGQPIAQVRGLLLQPPSQPGPSQHSPAGARTPCPFLHTHACNAGASSRTSFAYLLPPCSPSLTPLNCLLWGPNAPHMRARPPAQPQGTSPTCPAARWALTRRIYWGHPGGSVG